MTFTLLRSPHIFNCSVAAARNVSAAAKRTLLFSDFIYLVSLPTVVVFPTPLAPTTSTKYGLLMFFGIVKFCSTDLSNGNKTCFICSSRWRASEFFLIVSVNNRMIRSVVLIPTSASKNLSSSSLIMVLSIGVFLLNSMPKRLALVCLSLIESDGASALFSDFSFLLFFLKSNTEIVFLS